MKNNRDITIKALEDEILYHYNEIKTLEQAIALLKRKSADSEVGSSESYSFNPEYPTYPLEGSLLDKLKYLEQKDLRVWRKKDMDDLIVKIEGKELGTKTTTNSAQKIYLYQKKGEIINLKYSNSNLYSFYSTRPEWVERVNDGGKVKFRLLPEHEPIPLYLENLSEAQRDPAKIEWSGLTN